MNFYAFRNSHKVYSAINGMNVAAKTYAMEGYLIIKCVSYINL